MSAYLGLFGAAFVAATLLPFASEAAAAGLVALGHPPALVVVTATAGNTLGAIVNWAIGRGLEHQRHRRWFPVSGADLARAQAWFSRYGRWSLLLTWLPVVGDALTVVAGVMRVPLTTFTVLVAIGKGARYVVVAYTASAVL